MTYPLTPWSRTCPLFKRTQYPIERAPDSNLSSISTGKLHFLSVCWNKVETCWASCRRNKGIGDWLGFGDSFGRNGLTHSDHNDVQKKIRLVERRKAAESTKRSEVLGIDSSLHFGFWEKRRQLQNPRQQLPPITSNFRLNNKVGHKPLAR